MNRHRPSKALLDYFEITALYGLRKDALWLYDHAQSAEEQAEARALYRGLKGQIKRLIKKQNWENKKNDQQKA